MTRDEAYQQYQEALAKINKQAHEAKEEARTTLREQLKALQEAAHKDLKAIRAIDLRTRRSYKQ